MPGNGAIKVLLADSHVIFLRGLAYTLLSFPEFSLCGQATDSPELISLTDELRPDVLVVDYTILNGNGKISRPHREILARYKSLVLTGSEEDGDVLRALEAGARGYLSRETGHKALVEAMRTIATGQVILSYTMAVKIAEALRRSNGTRKEGDLAPLSGRQRQVLNLVAEGMTNKEIAGRLFLSEATVKSHMRTIMEKIRAKNRGHAAALASRAGLFALTVALTWGAARTGSHLISAGTDIF
ncbi:MAG: response regulator transcription factor [Chloroflexi bacterium]|nr:response regulator transcription factor [Chloroflexota bacterium]